MCNHFHMEVYASIYQLLWIVLSLCDLVEVTCATLNFWTGPTSAKFHVNATKIKKPYQKRNTPVTSVENGRLNYHTAFKRDLVSKRNEIF